jgi:transposase
MEIITFKFKKFSKIVKKLCVFGEIPLYFSKFSNKLYSNIQHLFLLVAKENTTFGYRKFVESLYDSKLPKYIGLRKIPHFTTLQKYSARLKSQILSKLVFLCKHLFREQGTIWGIDSTGIELDHASSHYCKRINRERPVKGFINFNAISDLYNKNFIIVKIRKRRRHDCVDLQCMYPKIKNEVFDFFVADKGYDSDKNHQMVFESGKQSLISMKCMENPVHKTKGRYRKLAKRQFEDGIYRQRNITESNFSAFKRKFGSKIKARKFKTQKVELLFKILSYNIERALYTLYEFLRFHLGILQSPIKI